METIARFFKFDECDTDFRRESLGGVTSFMTMAYIVAVNPSILSEALGRDLFGELVFATCVSAAIATLLMGVLANYPFALAPGMGLNAFFTYGVVLGMGVHWELA
ncbi:MAG: NCS2 family permease, partial [Candidatus Latescibacteria bacterium]|nr:NCS2 family permease [Candidatus Latescibacterota bacterium]